MSDKYYYEEGAIHHDHHKVINVGEIKDCDLEKLMKTFFKDGDGVSEEISQPRQNTKTYKPFTAKDADVFSVDSIHQQYWKDFYDVCYPRFGFESKEDGERTYEQKYEIFRQSRIPSMQKNEWSRSLMFIGNELYFQQFQNAYNILLSLRKNDNADVPMLATLLRIQQSISKKLRDDIQMMEYVYPRSSNISYEKYGIRPSGNACNHGIDYEELEDILVEIIKSENTNGESDNYQIVDIANAIICNYNESLIRFETAYKHIVMTKRGNVHHPVVYRLFMSYLTSLDEIKGIIEDYPAKICMTKLVDVRNQLIEEFRQNILGKHWYECITSKNGLDNMGHFMINHRDSISEEEEERFFYLLDEICILTDILKGNTSKYGLSAKFD